MDEATHLDDASGKVVKRDSANMTTINNLIVKADESSRATSLYPPPGLLFDKAICETSLTCVDNAQVIFQPYNNAGATSSDARRTRTTRRTACTSRTSPTRKTTCASA